MSNETMTLKVIAHIHTAFPTKFGIPRQSGLVDGLRGEIIFTPEYRNADALRGLEDFSHIWLVWQFSGAVRESWSPTVRPRAWAATPGWACLPPAPLPAQSAGPFQRPAGGHRAPPGGGPGAHCAGRRPDGRHPHLRHQALHPLRRLSPGCSGRLHGTDPDAQAAGRMPAGAVGNRTRRRAGRYLQGVLENDPRPSYQHDPERVYGMEFSGLEVHFVVDGAVLTVTGITRR